MSFYLLGVEGSSAPGLSIVIGAAVVLDGDRVYNGVSKLWCSVDDLPQNAVTLFPEPVLIESDEMPYTVVYCRDDEWFGFSIAEEDKVAIGDYRVCWFNNEQTWNDWRKWCVDDNVTYLADLLEEERPDPKRSAEIISKILMLDHRNAFAWGVKARNRPEGSVKVMRAAVRPEDHSVFDSVRLNHNVIRCTRCSRNRTPIGTLDLVNTKPESFICAACYADAYQSITSIEEQFVWRHVKSNTLYAPFASGGKAEATGEVQVCYYKYVPGYHFNRAEDEFWIRPRAQWYATDEGTPRFTLFGHVRGREAVPFVIIDNKEKP